MVEFFTSPHVRSFHALPPKAPSVCLTAKKSMILAEQDENDILALHISMHQLWKQSGHRGKTLQKMRNVVKHFHLDISLSLLKKFVTTPMEPSGRFSNKNYRQIIQWGASAHLEEVCRGIKAKNLNWRPLPA